MSEQQHIDDMYQESEAQDDDAKENPPKPKKKKTPPPSSSSSSSEDTEVTEDKEGRGRKRKTRKSKSKPGSKGKGGKGRNRQNKKKQPQQPLRAPDLPIVAVTENHKRSNPPIRVIPQEKSIEVGVKAALCGAMPDRPPLEYEFKSWKGTVGPSICIYDSNSPFQ
jgi:hypothetical protein